MYKILALAGLALTGLIIIKSKNKMITSDIEKARILALDEIKEKEGLKLEVYEDTLTNPTVGYGHLVLPQDGLKVGDTITQEQANKFLEVDFAKAFNAAVSQAEELGKTTPEFVAILTSVNYQLGTNWRSKFKNTWKLLKNGNYTQAIDNLNASLWNRQTPVRVRAFVEAIQNTYA